MSLEYNHASSLPLLHMPLPDSDAMVFCKSNWAFWDSERSELNKNASHHLTIHYTLFFKHSFKIVQQVGVLLEDRVR